MRNLLTGSCTRSRSAIDSNQIRRKEFLNPVLVNRIFFIHKGIGITCRQFQYGITGISRNNIPFVLRIQCPQLFQIDMQDFRYLLEMQHPVDMNRIRCHR